MEGVLLHVTPQPPGEGGRVGVRQARGDVYYINGDCSKDAGGGGGRVDRACARVRASSASLAARCGAGCGKPGAGSTAAPML